MLLSLFRFYSNRLLKTQFEDLSNELIYEIFDYFHYFYVYERFSKLNLRFQLLFIKSSLPLKINLSFISKSSLQNRYNSIIQTNQNRIISLNISKYFSLNSFPFLQSLTIQQIESSQIFSIINQLNHLPNLSSLKISSLDYFQNENLIYLAIFQLPKLKFCQLTFPSGGQRVPLPTSVNQCSTLERLIINGHCRLDQLISILSYLPNLQYLTCEYLYGSEWIEIVKIPESLISVCFTVYRMSFNEFKLLLSKIGLKLKRLRIRIFNNESFFHAEQWEELISNFMPCLWKFDLQYNSIINDIFEKDEIKRFNTKFWIERKWVFDHYYYEYEDSYYINFFSVVPYR